MTDPMPEREGKLLPFPGAEPPEVAPVPAPAPAVPEAVPEEVDEAEPVVLVDQPHTPDPTDLLATLSARRSDRTPIVPTWLRSRVDALQVLRWQAEHAAYVVGYHGFHAPAYALRLTRRSPRGAWRATAETTRWIADRDGRPIRNPKESKREEDLTYLQLIKHHDAKVRRRIILTLVCAFVLLAAGIFASVFAPTWTQWAALAVIVATLGVVGTQADQQVFDRPVIPNKVQKLTSDIVVKALMSLGMASLNKGEGIHFPAPITRDGPGWRADVDLPAGVTAAEVMEKRDKLASGLRRPLGCVWPEGVGDEHPGRVILWVGDKDMNKTKQPVWPLAKGGQVDLFKPTPYGTDQRGRWVSITLMYASVIIGAIPRMGKTFLLRLLCLIAALDPRAELHLYDLKGTGDLSPLECVAHRYRAGEDDDDIEYAVASMRELKGELRRRAKVIRELPKDLCPENKVTSELASKKSLRLHPIVVAVDECQVWFENPEYGDELEAICTDIVKRGPALGIIPMYATQRPDAKSLPTGISANAVLRLALKVMGHTENDMVLGSGMHKAGVRATTFSRKDLGIHYLAGEANDPRIVRGAYKDAPAAEQVAKRAHAMREAAGTLSGYALGENIDTKQVRSAYDLLEDILAITSVGEEKIWNSVVVDRLVDLRPEHYRWGHLADEEKTAALTARLKEYGVAVGQVWGTADDGQGANRRGFERAHVVQAEAERRKAGRF